MWYIVKYFKIIFIAILIWYFEYEWSYCVIYLKGTFERNLKIDRRNAPTEDYLIHNIAKTIPYLPIEDLNNPLYSYRNLNNSCAWYPSLLDVKIHNDYWQEFKNGNLTFYIFGAYYDNRTTVVQNQPVVRVLTTVNFIAQESEKYPLIYCQLWYDEQAQPIITPMKEIHKIWYYEWSEGLEYNYGHFVSCPVPQENINWVPKTISMVAQPCDKATNNVRVTYLPLSPKETRKDFAVCVKGLDFPYVDMSHRLVEYIETLRTLGAEKILMYQLQVHPNITKVLQYYEETGFLDYRPMSLSTAVSNLPDYRHLEMNKNYISKTLHEVIPYNDCLYRNMYRYKYVAVVDIDEVLMPLGDISNWHDLMKFAENITTDDCKAYASYCFRCIYFPCYPEKPRFSYNIPEYFYMLQHVERVKEHIHPDWATKCLHSTDYVIATHNHFSIHWSGNVCGDYSFETKIAQMNHYREPENKESLNDSLVDLSLWRMKDEIIENSMKVFEKLNFFADD